MGRRGRPILFVTPGPRSRDPDFGRIKNGGEQMNHPEVKHTLLLAPLLELHF